MITAHLQHGLGNRNPGTHDCLQSDAPVLVLQDKMLQFYIVEQCVTLLHSKCYSFALFESGAGTHLRVFGRHLQRQPLYDFSDSIRVTLIHTHTPV